MSTARSVNETIRDDSIDRQAWLVRMSRARAAQMIGELERVERDIIGRIERTNPETFGEYRLKQMLNTVGDMVGDLRHVAQDKLKEYIHDTARREREWMIGELRSAVPISLDFTSPSLTAIYANVYQRPMDGVMIRTWWRDMDRGLRTAIEREIRIGYIEGQTPMEIARRLRGTRRAGYEDGVFGRVVHRRVEALVNTALRHAQSVAREELYDGNSDLIKGVQIVATLDASTSLICMNYDGQVFDVGEGPRPPFHPNCRSATIPVLKSLRELGVDMDEVPDSTRASMDGQVPDKIRFPEWIKSQGQERQIRVLGKERWQAWQDGKVTLSQLSADTRIPTLAELGLR